jgi:glutamyl-tRNA reductase
MNNSMPIFACGINHKTAPIALREKIVFPAEKLALYLQDLLAHEEVKEVVLISTCNRSEMYCLADDDSHLFEWISRQFHISAEELRPVWYCYQDQDAVEYMMRVACGLESMVLGESQILGQMKEAFSESCAAGSIGPQFNRLFQHIFSVGKEIRTNTAIGACPVSIASAALSLAKQVSSKSIAESTVLLIGAGDTIQLVLRHLQTQLPKKLIIANRNFDNAIALAEKFSAESITFSGLPKALAEADVVISATSSPTPIVTQSMIHGSQQPLIIIDIAVPRDVDIAVADLPGVHLYSVDDLRNIIQHNLQGREHAAEKAQQVIKKRSSEFVAWLHSLDQVVTTIRAYRNQVENLCSTELGKASRQLQQGEDPMQVLANFAHALTNKLLHHPSVQLRQAGAEGRLELLELARELFAIPEAVQ